MTYLDAPEPAEITWAETITYTPACETEWWASKLAYRARQMA